MITQIDQSLNTPATLTSNRFLLFVENIIEAFPLGKFADVEDFKDISSIDKIEATSFILADSDSEYAVKSIAWKHSSLESCYVYALKQPLSVLLSDYKDFNSPILETFEHITNLAIPATDWIAQQEDKKIKTRIALELAELAIQLLPEKQKRSELATLRERSGNSDFTWNNLMAELEREFAELLKTKGLLNDDKDTKLKFDIQLLLKETDPIKYLRKKQELYKQGISNRDIDFLLNEIEGNNSRSLSYSISVKELDSIPDDNAGWLFPGLLPNVGLTILGGESGSGKTTFAYDAAASVIYDEYFLGEKPLKTGKVLFVNTKAEMLKHQVKSSFRNRGITDNCRIRLDWDIKQLNALEEEIKEYQPTLVVVDSFAGMHTDPNFNEDSPQARRSIQLLQALSERYSTSIILIHHANKNKDATGVNKLRGSSAIAAACSVVWLLQGIDNSPYKDFSIVKIRGSSPKKMKLSFDAFNGRFEVFSSNEDSIDKSVADYILNFMSLNPSTKYRVDELANGTSKPIEAIRTALRRLEEKGLIQKTTCINNRNRKLFHLTDTPPLPTTRQLLPEQISESIDINIVSGVGQELVKDVQELVKSWSEENEQLTKKPETVDIQQSQELVKQSWSGEHNRGGEGLTNSSTEMTNLTSVPKQETEYLEQQQLPLAPQTPTTALPDVGSFVKCEDKIFEITGHSALPGRLELEDLSGNKKCIHHKDITLLNSEEIATLKEQRQLKPKDKCRYVGTNEKYQNIIWEVVDVNNPFIVVVNNNTNNMFDADELRKIE